MTDESKVDTSFPIEFYDTRGTQVTGRHKDKRERLNEVLCDLQLAIDGIEAQLAGCERFDQFQQSISALARACSIFLRKTILGDRNVRTTRLLDDDVCRSLGLTFSRLRRIPVPRRQLSIDWRIQGGYMRIEKLDDETRAVQAVGEMPVAPLKLDISIEWPLPGAASWLDTPTTETPWQIRPEELFETESEHLSCDDWSGQQLVMFDRRGISLKEVIRTTATYEGAHSMNVSRLLRTETEKDTNPSRNPELHILNNIKICGIKFNHIVVIETALYLYRTLIDNTEIENPKGPVNLPTFCLVQEPTDDISSAPQNFLTFDGGVIMSFGENAKTIAHRIRPVT